jgi:hypothetical protein
MTQNLDATPAVAEEGRSTDKISRLSRERLEAPRPATVNPTRGSLKTLELQRSPRRASICSRS